MCLIAFAWKVHPAYPLVVAANRDEWRERPSQPAHWWPDHPQLLAGRDLQAGGTWMGITKGGRFAAVTNFRDPSDKRSTARSRGALVSEFLLGVQAPLDYMEQLVSRAREYNGFNLIVGDGKSLHYYGSREDTARAIEPGIHGLSNHLLDEPWPKVVHAREALRRALDESDPVEPLFKMLSHSDVMADDQLPQTGVGIAWERRLSAALITGEDYGTRASTVLLMGAADTFEFEERTRDGAGKVTTRVRFRAPVS
jgi:uncharacterized protein with NRDE domain